MDPQRLISALPWREPHAPGAGMAGGVRVRYRRMDGAFAEAPLNRPDVRVVVEGFPVREFRSYRGRGITRGVCPTCCWCMLMVR